MTSALITGVSGFVGSHLARHLLEGGWSIAGQDLRPTSGIPKFYRKDLSDGMALKQALRETNPEVIFHLAGLLKAEHPEQFYRAHVLGTVSLLQAVVEGGFRPKIVLASSSAVYGAGQGRRPLTEGFKLRPVTPYAASKAAQEITALQYSHAHSLPLVIVRTFNLLGPGLSTEMAPSAFARQIALAEIGAGPATIRTGDLSARRDFLDVRDAVRAYALLARQGRPNQAYNVASGTAIAIQACLDLLLQQSRVPIEVRLDPVRMQKQDVPFQVGSAARLAALTGWRAQISIQQSLTDLLNEWRQRVTSE